MASPTPARDSTAPDDRAPPTAAAAPQDLQLWLEITSIGILRRLLAMTAAMMLGFMVYNAVDLPEHARVPMVVHDAVTAGLAALGWWLIRRGMFPSRSAHLGGALLAFGVGSNILLCMLLLGDPSYVFYIDVIVVGVGMGMSLWRWAVGTTLTLGVATSLALWACTTDVTVFGRHLATVVVAAALASAIYVVRMRDLKRLFALLVRDRAHQQQLRRMLDDLDLEVEARTRELREANETLRLEIVEREKAEKEAATLTEQLRHAQRLESIGRLAGGVAHDFNNLLTVISSNVHLVLSELEPEEDHPLEDVRLAAERASHLTRQLLAFSRKQVVEAKTLNLSERIENMERMLGRLLGDDVELVLSVPVEAIWVDADATLIEQILMNLVTNASDAMPDGGRLEIALDCIPVEGARHARLRVCDDGVGMSAEVQERIFEPFFTTKGVGSGTGLGLSTVYGIVKQHDGHVAVASAPGQGTTFTILLPAVVTPTESRRASAHAAPAGAGQTILLVEDEPIVRRIGHRVLSKLGYEVLVAASADQALELWESREGSVDLLFTDVMMPGMNGVELAAELTARQPGLEVLFVSGYTGDYLQTKTGEVPPGTHLLAKPYTPEELARRVGYLLAGAPDRRGGGTGISASCRSATGRPR